MAAAPPALMEELIEECLLRLPPDDPANLISAALVCKCWRRIIAGPGFRRRFGKLHGRPPMLGFFHVHTRYGSCFTPTTSFRSGNADLRLGGWHAIDSRHGRVLLSSSASLYSAMPTRRRSKLAVLDPILGDHLDLPELPMPQHHGWISLTSKAAVLCASGSSCDHLDCHRGQFAVVLMDFTCRILDAFVDKVVDVYMYSSQAGAWSHVTSASQPQDHSTIRFLSQQTVTMVGNALYFTVHKSAANGILKYDMGVHEVSWVDLPPECSRQKYRILLTTTEQGGLGIVRVEKQHSRLHLWSRDQAGPNGVLGWAPSGIVELETVLPANSGAISTVAFVHGISAFFIMTDAGAFTVDLVSNVVRKVCGNSRVHYFVPYTSYCTPALGAAFTGQGPTAGVPSA